MPVICKPLLKLRLCCNNEYTQVVGMFSEPPCMTLAFFCIFIQNIKRTGIQEHGVIPKNPTALTRNTMFYVRIYDSDGKLFKGPNITDVSARRRTRGE
jgi:hypothetical protein